MNSRIGAKVRAAFVVVIAVLAVVAARSAAAQLASPRVLDMVVQIQGAAGGTLKTTPQADGSLAVRYSYRDNGRGPDVDEVLRLGPQDALASYRATGRTTFGASIDERFDAADGRVSWSSTIDRGEQAAEAGTLFVPLDGSPAVTAQIAASLLRRPDGSAPAIGGVRLRAERLATLRVPGPDGDLPVVLVAVVGADVMPWYVWLRDDESLALFALAFPGWAVLERGYEPVLPQLLLRWRQAEDEYLRGLQQRLAQPLPGLTVVRNVRWFDSKAARLRGPSDVYVHRGRIAAITAPGQLKVQADASVDGQGRVLLPGLFDMHAHLGSASSGLFYLMGGITSVREMGAVNDELARASALVDRGVLAGPRVHPAGFIEGRSSYSASLGILAGTEQEALAAVDWYAARGYRQVKLYNSIHPTWVPKLAAHARAQGMRVSGHVPAFMRAEQAVRAGYDELSHINQVLLNFVSRPGDDSRTLLRFTRVGEDAHRLDLRSPQVRGFLQLLRSRGTTVDPTLTIFESMFTQAQGEPDPGFADIAGHLPVLWQRGIRRASMDLVGARLTQFRASFRRMQELVAAMHRAGVPLVAGTDGFPGALVLQRELMLYQQAGIPAAQVLRIATWQAARTCGVGDALGSIEVGKQADLVLVEGDPTRDVAVLRQAVWVLKGDQAYAPGDVMQAVGLRPFVPAARVERAAEVPAPAR